MAKLTNDLLVDQRIIERNIRKGLISKEDAEKHIASLADVESNSERLGDESEKANAETGNENDVAGHQATPVAAATPLAASPVAAAAPVTAAPVVATPVAAAPAASAPAASTPVDSAPTHAPEPVNPSAAAAVVESTSHTEDIAAPVNSSVGTAEDNVIPGPGSDDSSLN